MSRIKNNYKATVSACYIGYITQAIVNNFAPLLFVTFNKEFSVSLDKIASIVSINFGIQLIVDLLSAKIVDKIGYRKMIVAAHIFSAAGLAGLGFFPYIVPSHYVGILIATAFSAIGGGLIEVLISPIVQACPVDAKSSAMSLLHSFYCWGHIFVVLLSTGFFAVSGVASWRYLAYIWAIIPILNALLFSRVTIYPLMAEDEKGMTIKELFKSGTFWALMILMTCSGASEQGISQWASAFAEEGLGVSKAVGDLAGPCAFALFMGLARVLHSKIDEKIDLQKFMIFSSLLCICAYLLASLGQNAIISLIGCGLCGFSVGVMWPGTFSIAAKACPAGGTALFALLALAGDLGCALAPYTVGLSSSLQGDDLKKGILTAVIFPIILVLTLFFSHKRLRKN